jgi:hypothetical protein
MIKLKFGEHTIKFNRVVGGWAWPSDQPGFFVILAERLLPKATGDVVHYYVIDEIGDINIDKLLGKSIVRGKKLKVQGVYGRPRQSGSKILPAMHYLDQWNLRSGMKGGPSFHIYTAPYVEDQGLISFHVNLIRSMVRSGNKRLFFGTSMLAGYLEHVPVDYAQVFDTQHPAVAALGYALANLDSTRELHGESALLEELQEEAWGGDF